MVTVTQKDLGLVKVEQLVILSKPTSTQGNSATKRKLGDVYSSKLMDGNA